MELGCPLVDVQQARAWTADCEEGDRSLESLACIGETSFYSIGQREPSWAFEGGGAVQEKDHYMRL